MANGGNRANVLSVGDVLPDATLPDQDGQPVQLSAARSGKWLVLYFYPKDGTAVCTQEACLFRDRYQDFQDKGAEVIGISSDGVDSHRRFAEKNRLPFRLLTDEAGRLRKTWGVPKTLGVLQGRVTYVVDPDGIIRLIFSDTFNAQHHINEALSLLR